MLLSPPPPLFDDSVQSFGVTTPDARLAGNGHPQRTRTCTHVPEHVSTADLALCEQREEGVAVALDFGPVDIHAHSDRETAMVCTCDCSRRQRDESASAFLVSFAAKLSTRAWHEEQGANA